MVEEFTYFTYLEKREPGSVKKKRKKESVPCL